MKKTDYRKLPVDTSEILAVSGNLFPKYYCEEILPDEARAIVRRSHLRKSTSHTYTHLDEDGNIDLLISTRKSSIRILFEDGKYIRTLNEVRRNAIVKKSKKGLPRYERRLTVGDSEIKFNSIDIPRFLETGELVFTFDVRSYVVTIEIDGMLSYFKKRNIRLAKYSMVRKFLLFAIDQKDMKIDCTCPDFRYRFAYTATRKGFKANQPEDRPSNITNPQLGGSGCKHIMKIIGDKDWIEKYTSLITLVLKLNPDIIDKVAAGKKKK